MTMAFNKTIEQIKAAISPKSWTEDENTITPHLVDRRGKLQGRAPFMAMPNSSLEAQKIIQICAENETAFAPQGGNTGLVGGSTAGLNTDEILISMKRMNAIAEVDAAGFTLTAEAGAILATVQDAAQSHDRLFPLSLASQGSCTVGGIISTNAGGIHVMRYGTTRHLVLGLEAVMPNGQLWNGLSPLVKDNTGYDLKSLLVGAEGTLGLVTKATLKLFPRPKAMVTAWLCAKSIHHVMDCFSAARESLGGAINAYEIMTDTGLSFAVNHMPQCRAPLSGNYPWHILLEVSGDSDSRIMNQLEILFSDLLERDIIQDGTIAQSGKASADLWSLREALSEAQISEGVSVKHDISLPVGKLADFVHTVLPELNKKFPGIRPVPFGHAGDGNLHFNLSQPKAGDKKAFLKAAPLLSAYIYEMVNKYGGSFSAEHGIGTIKKSELVSYKDKAALAAMRAIKKALDPENISNPGRVLDI